MLSLLRPPDPPVVPLAEPVPLAVALLGIFQLANPPALALALVPPNPSPAVPVEPGVGVGAWSMTTIGSLSLLLADRLSSDSRVVRRIGNGAEGRLGESRFSAWVGRRAAPADTPLMFPDELPKLSAPTPPIDEREKDDDPDRPCADPLPDPPSPVRLAKPDNPPAWEAPEIEPEPEMDARPALGKANPPIPPEAAPDAAPVDMLIALECEPGRPSIPDIEGWCWC